LDIYLDLNEFNNTNPKAVVKDFIAEGIYSEDFLDELENALKESNHYE
jgi:hypothetical protein